MPGFYRWRFLGAVALLIITQVVVRLAYAETYFVDQHNTAASDSNPGTQSQPWSSLYPSNKIQLKPGDVVIVKPGLYTAAPEGKDVAMINPASSGTGQRPIVFKAVPAFEATLQGKPELVAPVQIVSRSHIVVEGFNITHPGKAGIVISGTPAQPVEDIKLRNNVISGVRNAFAANDTDGIRVNYADDVLIENNRISDIVDGALTENAAGVKLDHANNLNIRNNDITEVTTGIYFRTKVDNIRLNRNRISNTETAIKLSSVANGKISKIWISENLISSTELGIQLEPKQGAIDLVFVSNNDFTDYKVAALELEDAGIGDVKVWNNIFERTGTGAEFIADVLSYADPPKSVVMMDFNLFASQPHFVTGLYSSNHSLHTLNAWSQYTAMDSHSIVASANFRDAQNNDFHLLTTSRARKAGRVSGEANSAMIDIGAYTQANIQIGFVDVKAMQPAPASKMALSAQAASPSSAPGLEVEDITAKPVKTKTHSTSGGEIKSAKGEAKGPAIAQPTQPTSKANLVTAAKPKQAAEPTLATTSTSVGDPTGKNNTELAMITPGIKSYSKQKKLEWEVRRALKFGGKCVLESNKLDFFDGYDNTGLKFRIMDDELYLLTRSNIDMSFKDVGVQVGANQIILADKVVDDQNVLIKKELPAFITQLRKKQEARIQLRFWPTYPATQTYSEDIKMDGFLSAYAEYQECTRGN